MVDVYRSFFEAILRGDKGTLLHCSAVKYRRSIAFAPLPHTLDVEKTVIMEDFLFSSTAVGKTDMNKLPVSGIPEAFGRLPMVVNPSYSMSGH